MRTQQKPHIQRGFSGIHEIGIDSELRINEIHGLFDNPMASLSRIPGKMQAKYSTGRTSGSVWDLHQLRFREGVCAFVHMGPELIVEPASLPLAGQIFPFPTFTDPYREIISPEFLPDWPEGTVPDSEIDDQNAADDATQVPGTDAAQRYSDHKGSVELVATPASLAFEEATDPSQVQNVSLDVIKHGWTYAGFDMIKVSWVKPWLKVSRSGFSISNGATWGEFLPEDFHVSIDYDAVPNSDRTGLLTIGDTLTFQLMADVFGNNAMHNGSVQVPGSIIKADVSIMVSLESVHATYFILSPSIIPPATVPEKPKRGSSFTLNITAYRADGTIITDYSRNTYLDFWSSGVDVISNRPLGPLPMTWSGGTLAIPIVISGGTGTQSYSITVAEDDGTAKGSYDGVLGGQVGEQGGGVGSFRISLTPFLSSMNKSSSWPMQSSPLDVSPPVPPYFYPMCLDRTYGDQLVADAGLPEVIIPIVGDNNTYPTKLYIEANSTTYVPSGPLSVTVERYYGSGVSAATMTGFPVGPGGWTNGGATGDVTFAGVDVSEFSEAVMGRVTDKWTVRDVGTGREGYFYTTYKPSVLKITAEWTRNVDEIDQGSNVVLSEYVSSRPLTLQGMKQKTCTWVYSGCVGGGGNFFLTKAAYVDGDGTNFVNDTVAAHFVDFVVYPVALDVASPAFTSDGSWVGGKKVVDINAGNGGVSLPDFQGVLQCKSALARDPYKIANAMTSVVDGSRSGMVVRHAYKCSGYPEGNVPVGAILKYDMGYNYWPYTSFAGPQFAWRTSYTSENYNILLLRFTNTGEWVMVWGSHDSYSLPPGVLIWRSLTHTGHPSHANGTCPIGFRGVSTDVPPQSITIQSVP